MTGQPEKRNNSQERADTKKDARKDRMSKNKKKK